MLYNENSINLIKKDSLEYVEFKNFSKHEDLITHCFTTRHGGVSKDECSSLNLGFNRNDSRENVLDNFKIISEAIGIDYRNMVFSNQVHEDKIKVIDEKDRGKGILYKSDIIGCDGLITNRREVAIVTFYADCVPVFFLDPVKKVIAISHSGWRGTVKEIGKATVKIMTREFGSKPSDIETAIGPSIGGCCFEVGEEVYIEFKEKLPFSVEYIKDNKNGKWNINLQEIIRKSLLNSGISADKINIAGICTKCNSDVFFSHRGDMGKTGSLAGIMQLK